MSRVKPAILRSSLLVRKGHAAPAAISDNLPIFAPVVRPPDPVASGSLASVVADKFTSFPADSAPADSVAETIPALPVESCAVSPQSKAGKAVVKRGTGHASPGARSALTLRLDHERHLRLSVFSAFTHRSKQDILIAALDSYVDRNAPDIRKKCACLGQRPADKKPGKVGCS